MKKTFLVSIVAAILTALMFSAAAAQGPAEFFRNIGRNVVADPQQEYALTEKEGPYLIFAAAFTGPNAQQTAHAVVLELRQVKKWHAYVYEMKFEFNASKDFQQARNPYTRTTIQYKNPGGGSEYAVLIGNFPSLEDRQLERTLADVRKYQPEVLRGRGSPTPFSMALSLHNPMLPPPNQRGIVDPFVERINKDRPYSLLRNPRRYTVQIATFTGQTVYEKSSAALDKLPDNNRKMTELEMGERAAIALCQALRNRGIEAYEFHDRYASIVTVGGFDSVERNPQVQQIIQQFQARVVDRSQRIVVIDGIECDPTPVIIEVPRTQR